MAIVDINQLSQDDLSALIAQVKETQSKPERIEKELGKYYPLSPSQESVWLVSQNKEASTAYNIRINLEFLGELNLQRLNEALTDVVARHQILRTGYRFDDETGQPVQYIYSSTSVDMPLYQHESKSAWSLEQKAEKSINLDIEKGEVYRCKLTQFSTQHYILTLDFHHIAFDGWSSGVLIDELRKHYLNLEAELSVIQKDYIDVSIMSNSEESTPSLAFWKDKLSGAPVTRLPADLIARQEKKFHGGMVTHKLTQSLTHSIHDRASQLNMSPFMFFAASLHYLLGRYNGMTESVIGSYVSGRKGIDSDKLIGCFVNNIVLRQSWSEEQTIDSFLQLSKQTGMDALAHQSTPFPQVVKSVNWQGDAHPIYQIGLVMQQDTRSLQPWGDIEVSPVSVGTVHAHMDLEVYVWPTSNGYELVLNYDANRYSEQRIGWVVSHLDTILTTFAQAPTNTQLIDIDLLCKEEMEILNQQCKGSDVLPNTIALLAKQLADHPSEKSALICNNHSISYSQLNQRVAQWIQLFTNHDVARGSRVGFWGTRGLEQQSVLIASVIYGVCYVPLDASLPNSRCQQIIQDAQLSLLAYDHESAFPEGLKVVSSGLLVNSKDQAYDLNTMQGVMANWKPDDELALLYTSGTTGTPKGVSVALRAVNARLHFAKNELTTTISDHVLQRTPLGFIDALWEVLDTVSSGATGIIALPYQVESGQKLAKLISSQQVSKIYAVPSLLTLLCQVDKPLPSVKEIYTTAEPLPCEVFKSIKRLMPMARVCNLYGSTEVNDVAWIALTDSLVRETSIGYAVSGADICIVDQFGRDMPLGCPGDLVVSGAHNPLNYTNHITPRRSLKRLNQQGFDMKDIAVVQPTGGLRLIGRADSMVKIRGNRVEIQEVQHYLREVSHDSGAAVFFDSEDQALVGCWSGSISIVEVRKKLLECIPTYMVPAQLYALPLIPLFSHGKINMPSLKSAIKVHRLQAVKEADIAMSENEKLLQNLFFQVLPTSDCDITKNVFDLGLSSLELNQVQHLINTTFTLDIDVVVLLQYSTIRELAAHLFETESQTVTKPARRGQRMARTRRQKTNLV